MPTEADRSIRLAFFELGDEDRRNLARLRPLLEKHADSFVAAFYRHLLSFEPARALLADPEVKDRLLVKQREYLLSLAEPGSRRRVLRAAAARSAGPTCASASSRASTWAHTRCIMRLLVPAILEQWQRDVPAAERVILSLAEAAHARRVGRDGLVHRAARGAPLVPEPGARPRRRSTSSGAGRSSTSAAREATARARAAEELASLATLVAGAGARDRHADGRDPGPRGAARVFGHRRARPQAPAHDPRADRAHLAHHPDAAQHGAAQRARSRPRSIWSPCCARRSPSWPRSCARHRIETQLELPARALLLRAGGQAAAALHQPVPQRDRRDARRRQAAPRDPPGSTDRIEVTVARHAATGWRPETLARIFDPFFSTKAAGPRQRPRAGGRAGNRVRSRRLDRSLELAGSGHRLHDRPSRASADQSEAPVRTRARRRRAAGRSRSRSRPGGARPARAHHGKAADLEPQHAPGGIGERGGLGPGRRGRAASPRAIGIRRRWSSRSAGSHCSSLEIEAASTSRCDSRPTRMPFSTTGRWRIRASRMIRSASRRLSSGARADEVRAHQRGHGLARQRSGP